jgi:hypothetical protein
MIARTEEVIRGIILNFCPLEYCCCDEKGAVGGGGGYGYHGQTHGVKALVVGCAFAIILGMEYEHYSIQKCFDIQI